METILTGDGSVTCYNRAYQESYHSITGAAEEAVRKYAIPCLAGIKGAVRILDICFGLGYNSAAAIDYLNGIPAEITCLEKDPEILRMIQDMSPPFRSYHLIRELALRGHIRTGRTKMELIIGPAEETVRRSGTGFDAVFLDPFSPKKNPELWTILFLKDVGKKMKPGGILATYSCARQVRDNLACAGFEVSDGPRVRRRGPSTIARKIYKVGT
ncbi:MAG: MnmC family methyltransferase [archaeon]